MPRFDPRQLNRAGMFSQGLLNRTMPTNLLGGRGISGPNIRQGGVALGPGRNTLIAPNPAASKAMGSAINRWHPPALPKPTSSVVSNTGGAKVSDIFRNARLGSADRGPQDPLSVFTPGAGAAHIQQAQQVQGVQGVQGGPDVNALAAAAGQRLAGPQGAAGPEGVLAPAQSFLGRMIGEKGSGKRSDIGRSMMSAGAAMMKGSPDGTFATIGQGLEAGLGGYQDLKEKRREELAWEQDEKRRKEVEAGIEGAIVERRDEEGNITRRALTDEEAAIVRGADRATAIALAEDMRQGTRARDAVTKYGVGMSDSELELIAALGDQEALTETLLWAKSEKGKKGRIAHLVEMGYSQEVAELAGEDAAATQAVLNRGMETTIMRDGSGALRIFHDGEFVGSAGEGAPEITAAEADNLALARQGVLWGQSEGARKLVRDEHTRLTASVEALPNLVETVEAINDAPPEYFDATGKLKLHVDNWLGLDDRALGQQVDQMLTAFGILNLDAFRGAISDRELVVALSNAGEIGKSVEMINAILARSINQTIDAATKQNTRAVEMDRMLASTEVAQAAVETGQAGLWTNQFGFDMGTEGELGDDGLYTGGTGLLGYKMRADQAMTDMLDAAMEEAGGLIMVDPETGYDAGSTAPVDTSGGLMGASQRAAARRRAEAAKEERDRLAYEEWKKSQLLEPT